MQNMFRNNLINLIIVSEGSDEADKWIFENIKTEDIVVTSDIPLASKCIDKGASVLKHDGFILNVMNIGNVLATRVLMSDLRSSDPFMQGKSKNFTKADKGKFLNSLEIKITKAKFLAHVNKNGKNYLLGSNGKLIKTNNEINSIPFIYGDFKNKDFFELKEIIDRSKLNYKNIKNLYYFPSGRWDIEFYSDILIKLPKNKLKDSINLSVNILSNKNFEKIKILDLRQENRVITNG